jgi:hypothetical protein
MNGKLFNYRLTRFENIDSKIEFLFDYCIHRVGSFEINIDETHWNIKINLFIEMQSPSKEMDKQTERCILIRC